MFFKVINLGIGQTGQPFATKRGVLLADVALMIIRHGWESMRVGQNNQKHVQHIEGGFAFSRFSRQLENQVSTRNRLEICGLFWYRFKCSC